MFPDLLQILLSLNLMLRAI